MNWEDTVLTKERLRELLHNDDIEVGKQAKQCLEKQAKLSFKVGKQEGKKEVVEFISYCRVPAPFKGLVSNFEEEWQAKLKSWGIKDDF